ncbi:o-succinylbenzoate synthase [Planococcus salinarum]|uniref:o-succinylbenzoate synthase n=1 Tax=Planococcus salinarum TaxID=622695 RepID=UPI000E3D08B8|nr:o-succinylbenzoate synthase [Planococcus salinarum]TAA69802.1 o-succinylbenzoate synthase [Planococcus salinarum]
MELTIKAIDLKTVKEPLKQSFKTSLQTVSERESLIVRVTSNEGLEGFGECVAFSTPWYTEETVVSSRFIVEHMLIPILLNKTLESPWQVADLFAAVKGNHMAKAAIETAVWDLFAKKREMPLWQMIGGAGIPVPAGIVVAVDEDKIAGQVAAAANEGYSRVKIKISPASNVSLLKDTILQYPDTLFFADANGTFSEGSWDRLMEFDTAGFKLIEQPFGEQQWELHTRAKQAMDTAICLDESICSVADAKRAIAEGAADIIVLKMGRLGGWSETLKVVELCRAHSIGMWVGGMIEFGVAKSHNLALASLPGITLPGDFSASRHFWERDIIEPEITIESGTVELSKDAGIGCRVDWERL